MVPQRETGKSPSCNHQHVQISEEVAQTVSLFPSFSTSITGNALLQLSAGLAYGIQRPPSANEATPEIPQRNERHN
jgi:hypothetical protein